MADEGRTPGLAAHLGFLDCALPADAREEGWAAFLAQYSDLIRYAIRKTESDPDAVGDAYAYVLEQLRKDDFRRLRAFDADGPAKLTTWLVVVVRRLVIDLWRRRSGRRRDAEETDRPDPCHELQALVSAVDDITRLPDESAPDPHAVAERNQRLDALRSAVQKLEPHDRLLLALRFKEGHSAREIAEAMSFPGQFHVYRRLRSVLAELREALEAVGIEGPRG